MGEGGGGRSASLEQEALIPTEDAIEALMNNLVAPLLPLTAFYQTPPTIDQQKTVAKQMHSVVLLYNYYHRKRFPELKFLTFEPFCKLASIAKPSLFLYMNFMLKNEKGYIDHDNHFSIVEKMVMDACNISSALDASRSAPNTDRWPISQVAVFLVDPKKEKCLLEFCYITEEVWSLVEKELDRTQINDHSSNKISSNVLYDEALEHEKTFQKFAYAAVEQKTGQKHSNFSIVEFHTTYSLNQEETTTRLYIMNYTEAVDEGLVERPVRDVISSLHEPLIRTGQTSEVTSAVKYYHLLPYLNALSDWLSREIKHCEYPFPSMRHPTDVNNHFLLESGKTPTTNGHSISRSNQEDQALSTPNNKKIKVENKATSNRAINNSPSGTDSSVVDCREKANATSINDQKIVNKSTLNEYKNRTNHTGVDIKRPEESCRSALSSVICIPSNTQKNAVLNQLQGLDDICCENGWTLPRYKVFTSTADDKSEVMFQASVTVKGLDLEYTVHGDMKNSQREARSSAAVYMLSKLRCRMLSDPSRHADHNKLDRLSP